MRRQNGRRNGRHPFCGIGECQTQENCVNGNWICPTIAGPELCNGKDDDCDGQIDDGFGAIQCGQGACKVIVPGCLNGQLGMCTPGQPAVEVCDSIDNNCDGIVDNLAPAMCVRLHACRLGVRFRPASAKWGRRCAPTPVSASWVRAQRSATASTTTATGPWMKAIGRRCRLHTGATRRL